MRTTSETGPKWNDRVRLYFESGWAFLIPYLAAYLLYAWLKWPVNAVHGTEGVNAISENAGVSSSVLPVASSLIRPPCLLHVYWFLHVMHLLLGSIALRGWWRNSVALRATSTQPLAPFSLLQKAIPWLCLALLFYIPGVYLEFPADPWQHYARVNEWSWLQTVTEHSFWKKSSYFLAYSLVGQIAPPVLQLKWFDIFYTGCCLLLCWQYYRLARALGLGPQVAIAFVLLQALLFGNNIFGFYRYYGMSSSVFAQLGAVALVRVALGALGNTPEGNSAGPGGKSILPRALGLLVTCTLLLAVTAFNHVQGLGIAGLGVAAVFVWRLIQWRHSTICWLGSAAVLLSIAAVLWWPKHPALDAIYRPSGWLTAWYGFNLLVPSSPAFGRAAAIVGLFGLFNLAAGVVLLWRNHVVGWLTVLPVAALCLPCIAIPFANSLAAEPFPEGGDVVVFPRMLLAIPGGLALVALLAGRKENMADPAEIPSPSAGESAGFRRRSIALRLLAASRPHATAFALLLLSLFALLVVPASGRYYNRLYNVLMVPPDDLTMGHIIRSSTIESLAMKPRLAELIERPEQVFLERGGILTTPGIGYALNATGATVIVGAGKLMAWPPSFITTKRLENLRQVEPNQVQDTPFLPLVNLFSASSQSGYLSTHWLPNDVALEHATQDELYAHQSASAAVLRPPQIWLEWFSPGARQKISAKGARVPMESRAPEERGRIDSGAGDQLIRAGDLLTLRPAMRTLDGNGWRVTLKVRGPGFASQHEFTGRPSPLGRESWISGDHQIRLKQPGIYTVELTGKVFWPSQTYVVRYHFAVQPDTR